MNTDKFSKELAFAKMSMDYKQSKEMKGKKYSKEQIERALLDPAKNYKTLQEVSLYLLSNSMTYRRLIVNFAHMVNYDVMLKPTSNMLFKKGKFDYKKSYYESALLIEKINPKFNFKWIAEYLYSVGEIYLYKVEDKKGILYKKLPEQICRISSVEDSVCLFSIDLTALNNADLLATMPPEIQNIYKRFTEKKIKKEDLVDGKWYELTKNAIAFNAIDSFLPKGYPVLSSVFPSLNSLEDLNKKVADDEKIDNLKIVHMKYDVNEEGSSIIPPEYITAFHQSVKDNLPPGCAVNTSPLEFNVYTTKNTSQQGTNYRQEMNDVVYGSIGSSRELFNGQRNSNQAIDASIKSDEIFALKIAGMFENYLNYELKKNKKTSYFAAKILPTTYYNVNEYKRQCETSLSLSGNGNQLRYLACCGYSPLEALSLLELENNMKIQELFTPALSSYNTSTENLTSEAGRPSAEDNGEILEREGD